MGESLPYNFRPYVPPMSEKMRDQIRGQPISEDVGKPWAERWEGIRKRVKSDTATPADWELLQRLGPDYWKRL